jgi:hypothetical protein
MAVQNRVRTLLMPSCWKSTATFVPVTGKL